MYHSANSFRVSSAFCTSCLNLQGLALQLWLCPSLTMISLFEKRHFAFDSYESKWLKFLNVHCSSPSFGGGIHGAHNAFLLFTLLLVPPSLADTWPICQWPRAPPAHPLAREASCQCTWSGSVLTSWWDSKLAST